MALEGLRELKKRETRQRISDVATEMFLARGFEAVTVTEVAAAAGVSEKTVYNYFPTKESLVLDQIQGQIERLVGAVRDRPRGSHAERRAGCGAQGGLKALLRDDPGRPAPADRGVQRDGARTPALRAAWSEHRHRWSRR